MKTEAHEFIVIGIDDNRQQYFSEEVKAKIHAHHVFSGGKRHHEIVKDHLPKGYAWIEITVPLDSVFEHYKECHEPIVVFASGDPLFFGFANTIKRKCPKAAITLFPWFNSLQTLAHRLVMPYHDMHIVSLTGRPWHELDAAVIQGFSKIGVLTDKEHTPATIAQRMLTYGYDGYTMHVGEHLGNKEKERMTTLSLEEVAFHSFEHPNCLILTTDKRRKRYFGIADSLFEPLEGRARMITKASIRLLTLSALELQNCQSFWDVGFCTGSISIEAKLQFPHIHITSFEIREEGKQLMDINSRRFGTPGIDCHIGDFLTIDTENIPSPDAVFIGGHGGKLKQIVEKIVRKLPAGGIIVFNSVSPSSQQLFKEAVEATGLLMEEPLHMAVNDYNPIDIMKARKPFQ